MAFVSITRARVRSLWFAPQFAVAAVRSTRQVRKADGFTGGSLLPDGARTFWTMTVWKDEASMRAYMLSGPHGRAMPKFVDWCDEASVVHWVQDDEALPAWSLAFVHMRRDGRPSKLRRPSSRHQSLGYTDPPSTAAGPLHPAR